MKSNSEATQSKDEHSNEERVLQVTIQQLIFNDRECFVLNIRDITDIEASARLRTEAKMVGLYNSTISHEMILPLKNIVAVSSSLEEAFEATSEKGK